MIKLKKAKDIKITTFAIDSIIYKGFYVDIVDKGSEWFAFLYHEDVCIKDGMFGCRKNQDSFEDFVELVRANLDCNDYIQSYIDEYMND